MSSNSSNNSSNNSSSSSSSSDVNKQIKTTRGNKSIKSTKKMLEGETLTPEEIDRIKQFIKALIIHRSRKGSPQNYHKWNVVENFLKSIYNLVRTNYKSMYEKEMSKNRSLDNIKQTIIKLKVSPKHEAEEKWKLICFDLLQSHDAPLWNDISKDIKQAFLSIEYKIAYPLQETILPEGNLRQNILKNMNLADILTLFTGKKIKKFSNSKKLIDIIEKTLSDDQRSDLRDQFNDGTSKIFNELVNIDENYCYDFNESEDVIKFLKYLIDTLNVDINIPTKNGMTLFAYIVYMYSQNVFYDNPNVFNFIKYIWKNFKVDVYNKIYFDVRYSEHTGTVVSTLLLYAMKHDKKWELLQMILQEHPLKGFYLDDKEHSNIYIKILNKNTYNFIYNKLLENKNYIDFDNLWIITTYPVDKVKWLIEHGGLDPYVSQNNNIGIRNSLLSLIDTMRFDFDEMSHELDIKDARMNEIRQTINETEKNLKQMIEMHDKIRSEVNRLGGMKRVLREYYTKYQRTADDLEPFFAKHKILGGKRKNNLK